MLLEIIILTKIIILIIINFYLVLLNHCFRIIIFEKIEDFDLVYNCCLYNLLYFLMIILENGILLIKRKIKLIIGYFICSLNFIKINLDFNEILFYSQSFINYPNL